MRRTRAVLRGAALALALAAPAAADTAPDTTAVADATAGVATEAPAIATTHTAPRAALPRSRRPALEPLVPALALHPYALDPGVRPFANRLAVSPGFGSLGSEKLFVLRVAYNPNAWLGYEGSLGHNPSQAVHAVLHTFNVIVRKPLPGRFQPYLSGGYGMMVVLPGRSVNADPVTKNALAAGGGLEIYIRSDLALRAEMRRMTVIGRQQNRDDLVGFNYREQTLALAFYRSLQP